MIQLNYFLRGRALEKAWEGVFLSRDRFRDLVERVREENSVIGQGPILVSDRLSCLVIVPKIENDTIRTEQRPLVVLGESESDIEDFAGHYGSKMGPSYKLSAPRKKMMRVCLGVITDYL